MNCKFTNVLLFAAGAAIGSAVTWKIVKTKYDRLIQEEIDSVKEAFADRIENAQPQNEGDTENEDEVDPSSDVTHIDWSDLEDLDEEDEDDEFTDEDLEEYDRLTKNYTEEKGGADKVTKEPYVIAPYDFGELDDYSQIELTYYEDGTLEDDEYNIVKDVEELIGPKALTTFGEYEDDAVFVRNERLKADFQILKDYRTYEEARRAGPGRDDEE